MKALVNRNFSFLKQPNKGILLSAENWFVANLLNLRPPNLTQSQTNKCLTLSNSQKTENLDPPSKTGSIRETTLKEEPGIYNESLMNALTSSCLGGIKDLFKN